MAAGAEALSLSALEVHWEFETFAKKLDHARYLTPKLKTTPGQPVMRGEFDEVSAAAEFVDF